MKVGYLVNTYPATSQTFIRREIQALEAEGLQIVRYAIRRWDGELVDSDSKAERDKTHYILAGRAPALLFRFLVEALKSPRSTVRACATCFRLIANARGGVVRHLAYLLEAASLKQWAARDGVQHIHAHFSNNPAAVALLCRRMDGPPFSFTAHGPDEFDDLSTASLSEKLSAAEFAVAISSFCRVQLARGGGMEHWEKLHFVRCGIDTDDFQPTDIPFGENTTFVCVGRLCPQKAQPLIVEAAALVAAKHPDLRVLMVGDGETRADIERRIAELRLERQVTLLGWRSNAEVRDLMASARALLAPSFAEGLPIVIMEGLALERPVITTFIAGIPELVDRECGWIIPAGSVEAIAQAMTEAIEAPAAALRDKGRTGRLRVMAQHDLWKNARMLQDLFARTAAQK